jgi:fructose-1,6-bisphosphatase/inositol monophosphatase family enzyme
MLERLGQPRSDVRTKSTGTDMVTEVDKASEELIVAGIRRGLNHWDLAAGALIASAAGARLGPIDGGPPLPGSVVAAPPALFEPLQELLIEAGAAEHA